jgi:ArsR family transcriptional regulator, arsenate/arsenite/antimonite-responsive transcriptional repressor
VTAQCKPVLCDRKTGATIQKKMARNAHKLGDEQMQAIAHAVADPRRFAMLQTIAKGSSVSCGTSIPCGALRDEHPISPATVSHHLKELESAGLIELARDGRCMNIALRRDVWDAYVSQLSLL